MHKRDASVGQMVWWLDYDDAPRHGQISALGDDEAALVYRCGGEKVATKPYGALFATMLDALVASAQKLQQAATQSMTRAAKVFEQIRELQPQPQSTPQSAAE